MCGIARACCDRKEYHALGNSDRKRGLCVRRSGRFLVTELLIPHRVLSTSARNGGQSEGIRYLVNHQSCEGSAHNERHTCMATLGVERYHDSVCGDLGLPPECVATMGTAANMNYATVVQRGDDDVSVTAIVTAGVQGNAACAGDPTTWRETPEALPKPRFTQARSTCRFAELPRDRGRPGACGGHHDRRQKRGPAATGGAQPVFHGSGHGNDHRSVLHRSSHQYATATPLHQHGHQAGRIHRSRGTRCYPGSSALAQWLGSRATRAAFFTLWAATA